MEQVIRKAYAKINLGLDVLRKRLDGYHEVKMVMQTVGLYDVLTIKKREGGEDLPRITLSVDKKGLPCDDRNLAYRAAELLMDTCGIKDKVDISINKNIPIAAGMAGGSSDAAAVFHGLNELFGLSLDLEDLKKLGVGLGADIPYCLMGGTALSEGIGEALTPLSSPPKAHVLLATPDIHVSTKFVYENLHADTLQSHPDIDGMVEALRAGSLKGITDRMGNVLETVTLKSYPVVIRIKEEMRRGGAENALMSGSGPTVFGIFTEKERAEKAGKVIGSLGLARQVFVTEFCAQAHKE